MFAEEWPLMLFTFMSQLAIGTFIILFVLRRAIAKKNPQSALQLTNKGLTAIGPVMVLALIFSIFHLGTPLGAYRALNHLGSSWLSREIFTAGAFLILWIFYIYSFKRESSSNTLGWITSLVGLAVVFSMASIYATSIRPAWTNVNTYIAFFGTTLVLGALGTVSLIAFTAKKQGFSAEVASLLRKVSLIGLIAIILPLLYLPVFITGLSHGGTAAQASSALLVSNYLLPLVIRWGLSLLGTILALYTISKKAAQNPAAMFYVALALVLVGEFMGRYIFYASAVSIMVG